MQQRIALLGTIEDLEDLVAGHGRAERENAAREQFRVDDDVRVDLQEGGGGVAAETVEAGEDFVEDYGEAGPGVWFWFLGGGG